MAYATAAELVLIWGADEATRSADRNFDTVEDAGAVAQALADASGEIDSYIGKAYELPLAEPYPQRLVRVCCDIAVYALSSSIAPYTKEKRQRYEDALRWLEKVAAGDLGLGLGPNGEDPGTGGAVADFGAEERQFTRANTGAGGLL